MIMGFMDEKDGLGVKFYKHDIVFNTETLLCYTIINSPEDDMFYEYMELDSKNINKMGIESFHFEFVNVLLRLSTGRLSINNEVIIEDRE